MKYINLEKPIFFYDDETKIFLKRNCKFCLSCQGLNHGTPILATVVRSEKQVIVTFATLGTCLLGVFICIPMFSFHSILLKFVGRV